jgi:hypothetical protein
MNRIDKALEVLEAVDAAASPGPWRVTGPTNSYIVNDDGDHLAVTISQHRHKQLPFEANARLASLSKSNLLRAMKAAATHDCMAVSNAVFRQHGLSEYDCDTCDFATALEDAILGPEEREDGGD